MGFTGLARWVNADADSLTKVEHSIRVNHNGMHIGKWHMSIKSYRSTFGANVPGNPSTASSERTMCAVTMGENVFVLLEDPLAPTRHDALAMSTPGPLTHHRATFLTVRPPGSLEQLLLQLKARWMPVRQAPNPNNPLAAAELVVEGKIYAIGTDWLVRVGLVRSKELIRGMLLEAEYIPLPVLHSPISDGTSEMVSNLLTSILPNVAGANTVAVTISDAQWQDVLWDREEELKEKALEEERAKKAADKMDDDDDVYVYGVEDIPPITKRDWVGVDRDRRSAYLVLGALRSENIL